MRTIDTAEALLAAARAHGLRLEAEHPALDQSGTDFLVLHALDEDGVPWVVRTPRRIDVGERAAMEHQLLRFVSGRLPVAVPDWRLFAAEVIAYPRLGGDPAAVVDAAAGGYVWRFDEKSPPPLFSDSLAQALAALHRLDVAQASATVPGLRSESPSSLRATWAQQMERARQLLEVPDAVWARWQRWLADASYWPARPAFVHGDLHPGHILVDGRHKVTGLLDWTEAHVGDPATDFALLFATLGAGQLAALLSRYQHAGGDVWPRMAEHIVETWSAYPVVVAQFALRSGQDAPRQLAQMLVDANAREIAGR